MNYREFQDECLNLKNNVYRRKISLDNLREAKLKYLSAPSIPLYSSPGTDYYGDRMIDRLEMIENKEHEAKVCSSRISVIVEIIDEIPLNSIRYFVWRTYIDCVPCTVLAKEIDMNPSYLRQVLREYVQRAIKNRGDREMTEMLEYLMV